MPAYREFQVENDKYVANFGDKGSIAIPPSKKLAIVTCSDARLNPAAFLGIKEGEAHIVRNAGGIAKDALRSIIISQQLLGTREIAVFHHTDCGMLAFTTPQLQSKLRESHPEVIAEIDGIDFYSFSDVEQSVKDDVKFLREHPLVLKESTITGWVYEVETGKVKQIV